MIRKILSILLLVAICFTALFSCKKTPISTADATRNYFPLTLGKYVVYDVDSTRYFGKAGTQYTVKMQMKYVITDTYTVNRKLSYIMDVFSRPYDGGIWVGLSVILVTPTATGLLYYQDNSQYNKMMFPVTNGLTWKGNAAVVVADSEFYYLKDWNYQYHNFGLYYFNGLVNFDNTVTILEDDQNVNYQNVDSAVAGYRTYAKEVYAYNVGMVYKEWTHYTFGPPDTTRNKDGYSVVMRAREHN
jgi:hypothetical protein